MNENKKKKIEAELKLIERRLANAEEYLSRNVNIEGTAFLHLDDWQGKSGHPLWMRNLMVPTMMKYRSRKEKVLTKIGDKAKDKSLSRLKRNRPK
jgi:hypothetical protein